MGLSERALTYALVVVGALGASAQTIGDSTANGDKESASSSYVRPVIVAPSKLWRPSWESSAQPKINWSGLLKESMLFASLQHSFRLATEPGTRKGLKGPFFPGWGHAASSLHGWSDGDPFYVNYVGHPMQGSVAGFIWAQNDRRYLGAEFGPNPDYWRSRLRATAFSFAYGAMFEIGPYSEASIGNVQSVWPQQGMVDHVITPVVGFAWMVAEDALDQLLIKRFEQHVQSPILRILVRGSLNPARSWANLMRFKVPWLRETRPGVFSPLLTSYLAEQRSRPQRPAPPAARQIQGQFGVASVELSSYFRPVYFQGAGQAPCLGGGAAAAVRVVDRLQWVLDVSGCNLLGMKKDWSGDTLTFLTGPQWTPNPAGRWSPHAHFLFGGMKVTEERLYPELRESLNGGANDWGSRQIIPNTAFTSASESTAIAVSAAAGLDLRLHPAFALRLANIEYRRSWNPVMNGQSYNNGLSFTVAMVLRMGTW